MTKVDQAEHVQRADGAERQRAEPVEPERRPTYRTHEQQSSAVPMRDPERGQRRRRVRERGRLDLFLFIGSFIIAEAMLVHGLDRRFAFNILSLRWVGSSTYRIIIAFGFIGAATSPFMSNTGAAAMMLPIALGIMASVGRLIVNQVKDQPEGEDRPERLRFGAALASRSPSSSGS